jgi:CubicO group peptidase (beta-lactamase class C family)
MSLDTKQIQKTLEQMHAREPLSGVVSIHIGGELAFGQSYGFANRSECIPNTLETRFQVASGCKIFTSVAVCQLVQQGKIQFETRLVDCLDNKFPRFDRDITIHQLLTHSSGIPDYADEEEGVDYEAIWESLPVYRMKRLHDFLPLFQEQEMKCKPGRRFSYSNAGFVLLGLIVEQLSGKSFTDHVEECVFTPSKMTDCGYFRADCLPARTALAYIEGETADDWRTNVYSVPVIGGADGGAYVTAPDMARFWGALYGQKLLDEGTTAELLSPHIDAKSRRWPTQYGYGVWITRDAGDARINCVEGWDPGVAFLSVSYPDKDLVLTIARNSNRPVWSVFDQIVPFLETV